MAVATTDLYVRPEQGWVLAATAPTFCRIKSASLNPWFVAVAASTPAATVKGLTMGRKLGFDNEFRSDIALTGTNVYVRIPFPQNDSGPAYNASLPQQGATRFGVIAG